MPGRQGATKTHKPCVAEWMSDLSANVGCFSPHVRMDARKSQKHAMVSGILSVGCWVTPKREGRKGGCKTEIL